MVCACEINDLSLCSRVDLGDIWEIKDLSVIWFLILLLVYKSWCYFDVNSSSTIISSKLISSITSTEVNLAKLRLSSSITTKFSIDVDGFSSKSSSIISLEFILTNFRHSRLGNLVWFKSVYLLL